MRGTSRTREIRFFEREIFVSPTTTRLSSSMASNVTFCAVDGIAVASAAPAALVRKLRRLVASVGCLLMRFWPAY